MLTNGFFLCVLICSVSSLKWTVITNSVDPDQATPNKAVPYVRIFIKQPLDSFMHLSKVCRTATVKVTSI